MKNTREENHNWKFENKQYLNELTRFMDLTEQIKDKELKEKIIAQMLRCDMELTKFAEEKILK
ncbi:MAG: hypothetical protein BHV96_05285 [Clostridium sp. CAG:354_28_25]|jgi:hypothetical protein|uniref:hypothetical protein n=1 Tax=Candidatus Merdicola sp. TaxID=3085652 RepID=UPI00095F4294|nr:MAG: hypothetical protein BHV96_05285 [Clostridium sp. CAG:354_28_25]